MTKFRFAFVLLAVGWALLLPAAAFAASRPEAASSPVVGLAVLMVYEIGRLICHQRPERSFFLFGAQLPVCARCAGIYAGAAVTAVVAWCWSASSQWRPTTALVSRGAARRLVVVALAPSIATIVYEWASGRMPGPWTRAVS